MPTWINAIYRIAFAIQILMKAERVILIPLVGIPGPEPARVLVEVAGAVVVKAEVPIILLTAVEIDRLRRRVGGDEGAVGVIREVVDEVSCVVREQPGRAVPVVDEVIGAAVGQPLADQGQPVVIHPGQIRAPDTLPRPARSRWGSGRPPDSWSSCRARSCWPGCRPRRRL